MSKKAFLTVPSTCAALLYAYAHAQVECELQLGIQLCHVVSDFSLGHLYISIHILYKYRYLLVLLLIEHSAHNTSGNKDSYKNLCHCRYESVGSHSSRQTALEPLKDTVPWKRHFRSLARACSLQQASFSYSQTQVIQVPLNHHDNMLVVDSGTHAQAALQSMGSTPAPDGVSSSKHGQRKRSCQGAGIT